MLKIEPPIDTIENIFKEWESMLGTDFQAYKNHVYRVFYFSVVLAIPSESDKEKLAIAACFHDIGIWRNKTFDYLDPSIAAVNEYLESIGRAGWQEEINLIINYHHKLTRVKGSEFPLVEAFRKADWIDVTKGRRAFGVQRKVVQLILKSFPNKGFHKRLVSLTAKEFIRHPLNPLPMMKL